ncbi:hypothetical protein AKH00_00495 [Microbacterium sp. GCS4]|nr:hypothetical protein AKH00_00495 [Microbacterium sp. GCS4]
MRGEPVIAAGLHVPTDLVQLLELIDRALHVARVDAGVLRKLLHSGPRTAVAVMVRDAEEHQLRRALRAGMVQRNRH